MLYPDMRCKKSSVNSHTRKIQCVSDTRSSDHRHAIFEPALSVDCNATNPSGTNFKRPDSPNKKLIQATLRTMRSMFFIISYFTAVFIGSRRRTCLTLLVLPSKLDSALGAPQGTSAVGIKTNNDSAMDERKRKRPKGLSLALGLVFGAIMYGVTSEAFWIFVGMALGAAREVSARK